MASTSELSTNARKLQEDEIERLVKCRVRSETEARKAAEVTMKRAVQEARELKKELMIMRQEKEELKQDTRKATMVAAMTPTPGGVITKDDIQKKLTQEKTKRKELATQLEQTQHELIELREQVGQQEAQLRKAQAHHDDAQRKAQDELKSRQRDFDQLQDETKKLKATAEEAKRKCQRAVKDKKEELQKLMDENAELSKRCEGLERLADENAKLRKHLEKAKDKQGGVADEWQRRLDQREQAFLRQEQDNKQRLAKKQCEIDALTEEKDVLEGRLKQVEQDAVTAQKAHTAALEREASKYHDLVVSTKQLQERMLTLKDAGRAADRARLDAEARLAKAEELRETAEAAADAVENRAEKLEAQLGDAKQQLEVVEKALKKKGITLDYLIKSVSAGTANGKSSGNNSIHHATTKVASSKEPKGPEENDEDDTLPAPQKKVMALATLAQPAAMTKNKSKATLETRTRPTISGSATQPSKPLLTKARPLVSAREGSGTNNNQNHRDREPTPECVRK